MLDLKFIAANRDLVEKGVRAKGDKRADIGRICDLNEERRKLQIECDELKRRGNETSELIPRLKKEGKDVTALVEEGRRIRSRVQELERKAAAIEQELRQLLEWVPNLPAPDVPVAEDARGNKVIREWGEEKPFSFPPKDHLEIVRRLGLVDLQRAAKISGSHFLLFCGQGALLERALINWMLDVHTREHGYTELSPPYLVNRQAMFGTGQIPKLEGDMYQIPQEKLFLIPTAEVPVTNIYQDEILDLRDGVRKFCAYSACFRREAGAYGADTRGMMRVHQFDKVELVKFTRPEISYMELETLVTDAEDILKRLGIRYRVVLLSTGDMSFASAKTYDIEAWAPGLNKWLEVSSCSNFTDFQARRGNIRFRDESGKVRYVHTLNGSGVALPRTVIAILEQFQREDGSVVIPPPLRPYLHGLTLLGPAQV